MASNINSSLALVTSSRRNYYDVFVTFRGEDTRNNFTDFLFDALETKDILVFRDNTNLKKGGFIGPELFRAIKGSQIFIAVFSKNYASSTWCLQELEKIWECVQGSGKHVLPVFYDVDPSEVRKQNGIYGEAFTKHGQRFQQEFHMVSRWREALKQVGGISGWDLRDKPQSVEIKKIVQTIMKILEGKSSYVSKDLVGINFPIEELHNHLLLDSVDGVRAIGICGMGGIGKTTLAMALYGQVSHRFGASCFIEDVSKIYRLHDGPLGVQKQILLQTQGIEHHQICNRYKATNMIRSRLCYERALVILDNVNHVEQLEKIAVHREWLGPGSRIIIISRDEHILKEYGVDVVYKVPLLNRTESHNLFCRKAFKVEKIIMSNYENLVDEILDYAEGLPLAITVLGSFLFSCSVTEWKSALARLRESPNDDVMNVLQLSFDGLMENEKEIFLHIACFFNSLCMNHVKNILNCCGFHADIGLRILIDKSLISIWNTWIEMHPLLQELGRKFVQENSSKEQRKWSRVWSKTQLYNVMKEKMEKHVEAIVLLNSEGIDINVEQFSKMSNLRLLVIMDIGNISGSLSCLSNELRYVEWYRYPFRYLPSSFHPNKLVELILQSSNIKQLWTNKKYLPNLSKLDLSDSRNLENITDFGEFPNLEWLSLEGCDKLVELDPSIGLLRKLVYLNLRRCYNLLSIPNNIFGLSSLEDLNMCGCSKVFNNSRHLMKSGISSEKKKHHDISESASHYLPGLKWIIMDHDSSFLAPTTHTYVLPSLHSLYCLCNVDISFCNLSQVPDAIESLHWLERLHLGGNYFVTLPSLRKLSKLEYLNLEHCKLLESLPQLPSPTTIGRKRDDIGCHWLTGLFIFNCPKLGEREGCTRMTFSWMIQFIQANLQSHPTYFDRIQIITPGNKIPSWINNQSLGGSIPIDLSLSDNNNSIGFVCCALLSMTPQNLTMIRSCPFYTRVKLMCYNNVSRDSIFTLLPLGLDRDLITTKSNHLWLIYFPRESYIAVRSIWVEIIGDDDLGMEVKSCGYRFVCKQDLQKFNIAMMNHERVHYSNDLAGKLEILEILDNTDNDEPQPQPQP